MKRLALVLASFVATAAVAAPARAGDDVSFGLFFGGSAGHRPARAAFGVDVRRTFDLDRVRVRRAPRFDAFPAYPTAPAPYAPAPFPAVDACGDARWIPAHDVCVPELVTEPAVYEERCVPVYETVCVPIYDEVRVPVYETRCVPVFDVRIDPRAGRPVRVRVGERVEQVVVGERLERVRVGERRDRVVVGERTERILVRAEVTRTVVRTAHVPGRFVTVVADRATARGLPGEVLTEAEYAAEVAAAAAPAGPARPPVAFARR